MTILYIYKFIKERFRSKGGETAAIIAGSYFGLVVASLCAAVEFGIQPLLFTDAAGQPLYCPYGLGVSIPAMVIPHLAVAGPVEVLFTLLIVAVEAPVFSAIAWHVNFLFSI